MHSEAAKEGGTYVASYAGLYLQRAIIERREKTYLLSRGT